MDQDPQKAAQKQPVEPRASASIVLISPKNEVLLLRRTATSSAFPDAFVFPGGNVSTFHEPGGPQLQGDSPEFRSAAIRETFEESGILLAVKASAPHEMLRLSEAELAAGRKKVHANELRFGDWLKSVGGVADVANLHPCTRWVTPKFVAKRFNTQMYIYLLPEDGGSSAAHVATSDGGLEHTEAVFAPPRQWLQRVLRGDIILFPPQIYLLALVAEHVQPSAGQQQQQQQQQQVTDVAAGRRSLLSYLAKTPADGVPWNEKVITPLVLGKAEDDEEMTAWNGKILLNLAKPRGDSERLIAVEFQKGGPMYGEVATRDEIRRRAGPREKL